MAFLLAGKSLGDLSGQYPKSRDANVELILKPKIFEIIVTVLPERLNGGTGTENIVLHIPSNSTVVL